ncbi:S-locus-specific glycoprotein S6-like [Setaria italica]|uniref:S-locus-specific glycoprotein S6-like n=1 Tax=Setaria italica TaxID=4555 RepID=UPI0003509D24|nr:S-locus-specific glycoprotein S6-like [Setaria italica]
MEATCSYLLLLSFFLLLPPRAFAAGAVADTFSKGRNITDNETLVSADGAFTMGFFSPGVSTKRYLGIWFSVSIDAVCWVANRGRPVNDNSGVLMVSDAGSLLLLDSSGQIVWSSNSTSNSPVEAQLINSGDLVLRNRGSTTMLWHSFDYPSNVLLSGMKVGNDFWSGAEWHLTSWRSADDPSLGAYRRVLDTTGGLPDNVVWQGNAKTFRTGPWNGLWFSGIPEVLSYSSLIEYRMEINWRQVTYGYIVKPGSAPTYVVLTDTGMVKRLVWDAKTQAWQTYYQGPRDVCDVYGKCGAFGLCNSSAAATSFCSCLKGFSPASPSAWNMKDTSGGCRRNVKLDCGGGRTTDGFLLLHAVKLPDTHNATVDKSITVDECRARCLANCSCLAYAAADIRGGGGGGSGCVMWTDDIVDLRYVDQGQDMYLRLAKIELPLPPPSSPSSSSRQFPTAVVAGASAAAVVAILIALLILVVVRKRRRRMKELTLYLIDRRGGSYLGCLIKDLEVFTGGEFNGCYVNAFGGNAKNSYL